LLQAEELYGEALSIYEDLGANTKWSHMEDQNNIEYKRWLDAYAKVLRKLGRQSEAEAVDAEVYNINMNGGRPFSLFQVEPTVISVPDQKLNGSNK
jgi:hypothetical protein